MVNTFKIILFNKRISCIIQYIHIIIFQSSDMGTSCNITLLRSIPLLHHTYIILIYIYAYLYVLYKFRSEGLYWVCVFRGTLQYICLGLNVVHDFVTSNCLFSLQ